MIYLVGGAARSGKTRIARRLLQEKNVSCFCTDYFVSALDQGAPELGIEAESPNSIKAPKLWRIIVPLITDIILVEPEYTVEGDGLWTHGAASLIQANPGRVRACFLGYAAISPERKLAEIRQFGGGVNDWIQKHSDAYILDLAREMIDYSQSIQDECRILDIPYFDVSEYFTGALEKAYESLIQVC